MRFKAVKVHLPGCCPRRVVIGGVHIASALAQPSRHAQSRHNQALLQAALQRSLERLDEPDTGARRS